jgi:glutamate dehydrogenase/leucine dehydrogenase
VVTSPHDPGDDTFHHVYERHEFWNVDLRQAAIATGVERIAEATQVRGLFP